MEGLDATVVQPDSPTGESRRPRIVRLATPDSAMALFSGRTSGVLGHGCQKRHRTGHGSWPWHPGNEQDECRRLRSGNPHYDVYV